MGLPSEWWTPERREQARHTALARRELGRCEIHGVLFSPDGTCRRCDTAAFDAVHRSIARPTLQSTRATLAHHFPAYQLRRVRRAWRPYFDVLKVEAEAKQLLREATQQLKKLGVLWGITK